MPTFVCVWLYGEYSALYISKTNKNRNTKFNTQYQINVLIVFLDFAENQKKKKKKKKKNRSEYYENGSKDFLQIASINNIFYIFFRMH